MADQRPVPDASPLAWGIYRRSRELGIDRAELERRAGLGSGYIRDIYRGKSKMPGAAQISAIAIELGCGVEDLNAGSAPLRDQQIEQLAQEEPNKGILLEIWSRLRGGERTRAIRFMLDLLSRR